VIADHALSGLQSLKLSPERALPTCDGHRPSNNKPPTKSPERLEYEQPCIHTNADIGVYAEGGVIAL
jgi:hypothetical protein